MNDVANFLVEMDPFAWEPAYASRIDGLGGKQPAPEGAYTFRTTALVAPAGLVTVTIDFHGLRASRGTLLIEIAGVGGPERRQLGLRTLSLATLAAAGGVERITLVSDRRDTYAVAGYIYDESDATAEGMTVRIAVGTLDGSAGGAQAAGGMARVARLAGVDLPSFAHPVSQTWSSGQMKEPAFRAVCNMLELAVQPASWSAAFLVQALRYQLGDMSGLAGLGVGASAGLIAQALTSTGALAIDTEAFDPGAWPPADALDFAWLNVEHESEPPLSLFVKACCLIERLRVGGVLAMAFPFEHGRMPDDTCSVPKRGDVEIIALKMLAGGHSVAQLKFRAADNPLRSGTRTPFGMIVRRME